MKLFSFIASSMNYINPNYINNTLTNYDQRLAKVEQTMSRLLSLVNKLKVEMKENEGPITVNTVQIVKDITRAFKFSDGYVYYCGIDKNNGNNLWIIFKEGDTFIWNEMGTNNMKNTGSAIVSIGGQQININTEDVYEIEPIAYSDIVKADNGNTYQTLDLQIDGITLAREIIPLKR